MRKPTLCIVLFTIAILLAAPAVAENEAEPVTQEELIAEIERQAGELELSEWQSYFEEMGDIGIKRFGSVAGLILSYAERGSAASPGSIWDSALGMLKEALAGSMGMIAAVTAAAVVTCAAGILPLGGVRSAAGTALGILTVLMISGLLASLGSTASACVKKTAGFTEACLPVMTVLLSAVGATATAGVMQPLMLFLAGTMTGFIEKVIIPLILVGGVVCVLDCLDESGRLASLFRLIKKTVSWLMGLAAVLYFGVCAVQGLTVSAADGISVRTAKYAIDKLLPSTGGFIGGSADTFMSCALLVKNGAGAASVAILIGVIAKPLLAIGTGAFVFRAAAALAGPAASPQVIKMLGGAADIAGLLFGAAAVAGFMFVITVLVFTAAGGASAGLW